MPVNTKAIKGRIKSVKNTKKITKAMEMVSAAKMRKAVEAALATRMYATLARELMEHLGHIDEPNIPLLEMRPVSNVLVVLMSSNRGLCGSFNSNIFKNTKALMEDTNNIATHRTKGGEQIGPANGVNFHILGIGKKSAAFAKKHGYELVSVYDSLGEKPAFEQIIPIAQNIIEEFKQAKYDKVLVAFTDFKSSLEQVPKMRQLLPISEKDLEKMLADIGEKIQIDEKEGYPIENYLFEPNLDAIIEYVLPRLVEIQLYQALLESSASEHSARMVAMKNASESAGDMIDSLTLQFNKARQAAITQEIAEIAGGAAALS